jgi:hypothetical protein
MGLSPSLPSFTSLTGASEDSPEFPNGTMSRRRSVVAEEQVRRQGEDHDILGSAFRKRSVWNVLAATEILP